MQYFPDEINGTNWSIGTNSSVILQIKVTNNEGAPVKLKSLTCQLGIGVGSLYGTGGYVTGASGTGTAKLAWSGGSVTATVSKTVSVASAGTSSSYGYFNNIGGNSGYNVTFTFSGDGISISNGSSVTFNVTNASSASNRIITARKDTSQSVTGVIAKPITGSITNVKVTDQTILYGGSGTLNCTYSTTAPSAGRHVSITYQLSSGSATVSGDKISNVTAACTVKATVTITCDGYTGSLTGTGSGTINCKLNAPTCSLDVPSTGGFTIGNEVTPTADKGNNPFSMTTHWQVQIDSGSFQTADVPYETVSGNSIRFRAYFSKDGYVASEWSNGTDSAKIYYEPRDMASQDFKYYFEYQEPDSSSYSEISSEDIIAPGGSLRIRWESFLTKYNLGNFNYVRIRIIDTSNEEVLKELKNTNNPSAYKNLTTDILTEWASKTVKIELACTYSSDGSSYKTPQSTATFTSVAVFVGGLPEVPEIIYPSSTEFFTANSRVRLIFKVKNQIPSEVITDISVEIRTSSSVRTKTYLSNQDLFFSGTTNKPQEIPSGTIVDFTVPADIHADTGTSFRIMCKTRLLESDWTEKYTMTRLLDSYVEEGSFLKKTDLLKIGQELQQILDEYSNILSMADIWKLPQELDGYYLVEQDPYTDTSGVIKRLESLYKTVTSSPYNSVPPNTIDILSFDKINTTSRNEVVNAKDPPYQGTVYYTPIGNYFNYIIYVMKNML